jgi:hypothetical protein
LTEIFLKQAIKPLPLLLIEVIESFGDGVVPGLILIATCELAVQALALVMVKVYIRPILVVQMGVQLFESESPIDGFHEQMPFPFPFKITGLPAHTDVSFPAFAVGLGFTVTVIELFEVAVSGTAQEELDVKKQVTISLLFKAADVKTELFPPTLIPLTIH